MSRPTPMEHPACPECVELAGEAHEMAQRIGADSLDLSSGDHVAYYRRSPGDRCLWVVGHGLRRRGKWPRRQRGAEFREWLLREQWLP